MIRASRVDKYFHFIFIDPVARLLRRTGVKSVHLSLLGLIMGAAAGAAFALDPYWGGWLTVISSYLDTVDGPLARLQGNSTRAGAFLDSVSDRFAEFLMILGIWFFFYRTGAAGGFVSALAVLAAFGSLMVEYIQARAEGLQSSASVGLFERAERLITLMAGGIASRYVKPVFPGWDWFPPEGGVLVIALLILAAGTNWTAGRRFIYGFRRLRREEACSPRS